MASGKINSVFPTVSKTEFTPTKGSVYSAYDGCFYETYGRLTHVHLGIQGLTQNTVNNVYTLPASVRPKTFVAAVGTAGGINTPADVQIRITGEISVIPNGGTFCGCDIFYLI